MVAYFYFPAPKEQLTAEYKKKEQQRDPFVQKVLEEVEREKKRE